MGEYRVARTLNAPSVKTKGAANPPFNTLTLGVLRIHPAIGIARVGHPKVDFFLGPEIPGEGPVGRADGCGSDVAGGKFKVDGEIKRQAQRFYLFEHGAGDTREINLDHAQVESIEWLVHLANTKPIGETIRGQETGRPRRNQGKSISGLEPAAPAVLRCTRGAKRTTRIDIATVKGDWTRSSDGKPVFDCLGELHHDDKGRLVVTGGTGEARPFTSPELPPLDAFNNDGWLDDVSDGYVKARVKLKDGREIEAMQSWLLVAPPDFAPDVRHVVNLYDVLWDLAAGSKNIPLPNSEMYHREPLVRSRTTATIGAAIALRSR